MLKRNIAHFSIHKLNRKENAITYVELIATDTGSEQDINNMRMNNLDFIYSLYLFY